MSEAVLATLWRRRDGSGADADRHRRGAQRLSERARRPGYRDRDRARDSHRGRRSEVRSLPARLDPASAEGARAGALAVRQPRAHADELAVGSRVRRRAVLVRACRARRHRDRRRPGRGARCREDRLASGADPLREPDHRGRRLRRARRLGERRTPSSQRARRSSAAKSFATRAASTGSAPCDACVQVRRRERVAGARRVDDLVDHDRRDPLGCVAA